MRKVLKEDFFNRDTKIVAEDLLGKFLVHRVNKNETRAPLKKGARPSTQNLSAMVSAMITQTEAYDGPNDLASHASKGKTARTEIMFGSPGIFYVYLCYGMHYMLNIVTREKDYPAAVLIRGIKNYQGPGQLTRFLKIDKSFSGKLAVRKNNLWFEDRGVKIPKSGIKKLPRVGVDYAGPVWSSKNLRFMLKTKENLKKIE